MRYRYCIICRHRRLSNPQLVTVLAFEALLGEDTHHHHVTECDACQTWWFADIARNLTPLHRDTGPCDCPENATDRRFHHSLLAVPEERCTCSKARVDNCEEVRVYPQRKAS
jgi:hypothetical protein